MKEKRRALKALRRRMRGLIQELTLLLAENDPRWLRFGLKMPARIARPDSVKQVNLTALGNGKVLVEWTQAPRATRFRIQVRRADVEGAEFENAKTVNDSSLLPNVMLKGFTPGETIEVHVIAANEADEARPSPVGAAGGDVADGVSLPAQFSALFVVTTSAQPEAQDARLRWFAVVCSG